MIRLTRVLALLAACLALGARAESTPELADLIARARAHQEETGKLLRQYSWVQSETFVLKKPSGEIAEQAARKLRVYPIEGGVFLELLEVDGRAPKPKELKEIEKLNARSEKEAAKREASDKPDDDTDASGALLELLGRTRSEVVGRVTENGREL